MPDDSRIEAVFGGRRGNAASPEVAEFLQCFGRLEESLMGPLVLLVPICEVLFELLGLHRHHAGVLGFEPAREKYSTISDRTKVAMHWPGVPKRRV